MPPYSCQVNFVYLTELAKHLQSVFYSGNAALGPKREPKRQLDVAPDIAARVFRFVLHLAPYFSSKCSADGPAGCWPGGWGHLQKRQFHRRCFVSMSALKHNSPNSAGRGLSFIKGRLKETSSGCPYKTRGIRNNDGRVEEAAEIGMGKFSARKKTQGLLPRPFRKSCDTFGPFPYRKATAHNPRKENQVAYLTSRIYTCDMVLK